MVFEVEDVDYAIPRLQIRMYLPDLDNGRQPCSASMHILNSCPELVSPNIRRSHCYTFHTASANSASVACRSAIAVGLYSGTRAISLVSIYGQVP